MAFWDGLGAGIEKAFGVEMNNLPLFGSAFTNQNEKSLEAEQRRIAAEYAALAPQHAQAQQQSMQNAMSAYVPANRMLGAMLGPQGQVDFGQLFKTVLPEGHPGNPPNTPASATPTIQTPDWRVR